MGAGGITSNTDIELQSEFRTEISPGGAITQLLECENGKLRVIKLARLWERVDAKVECSRYVTKCICRMQFSKISWKICTVWILSLGHMCRAMSIVTGPSFKTSSQVFQDPSYNIGLFLIFTHFNI